MKKLGVSVFTLVVCLVSPVVSAKSMSACMGGYALGINHLMKGEASKQAVFNVGGKSYRTAHVFHRLLSVAIESPQKVSVEVLDTVSKKVSHVELVQVFKNGDLYGGLELVNGPDDIEPCGTVAECKEVGNKPFLVLVCGNDAVFNKAIHAAIEEFGAVSEN